MVDIRFLFSVIMTFVVLISRNSSASDVPCDSTKICTGCKLDINNTRSTNVYQCMEEYALTGYVIKRRKNLNNNWEYECFNLTNTMETTADSVMNFTVNENNISVTCHNGSGTGYRQYIYCVNKGMTLAIMPECTLKVNLQLQENMPGLSVTVKWILIIITTLAASICISTILAFLWACRKRRQDIPWTRQNDDKSQNELEVTSHGSMVTSDDESFIGESVAMTNAMKPEAQDPDLLDKQADIDVVSNKSDETNQSVNDEIIKDNEDGSASNDDDTQIKTETKENVNGGIKNESKHGNASGDDIIQITTETNESVNDEITKDNGHMGASGDGDTKMTTGNSSKEVAESDDDSNNTYDTIVSGKTPKHGISISDKQDSEDTVYDHLHARAKAEATSNIYSHMAELREITNYNADYAYVVKRGTERDIVVHNMEQIDDTSFSSKATQSETRSPNYDPEDSSIEADAEEDATEQDEEDAYSQILF